MMPAEITKDEILAVFPKVAQTMADIPRLVTPETFCRIVARGLRAGPGRSVAGSRVGGNESVEN